MPASSKQSHPAAATTVLIVERNGELRPSEIKECSQLELAKKCKHRTSSGFAMRAEWAYSGSDVEKFSVELWAREDGTAGQENKYEFPPPVDTILFFGACALVARDMTPQHNVIPLTLEKWDKMYNFLFGGFDTLANCDDDDYEYDELDSVPAHRKTKDGYLKDGFVVDECEEEEEVDDDADDDDDDDDDGNDTNYDDEEETTSSSDDTDDYDSDSDTNGNNDPNNHDNNDNDNNDNDGEIKKCTVRKASQKKNTGSKKRGGGAKDELAIPSFELVEESYEYSDD